MLKSRGEEWRDRMLEKKRARVGSVQLRNDKKKRKDGLVHENDMVFKRWLGSRR